MHYVAKVELLRAALAGLDPARLGAYPVRRGESDEQTLRPRAASLERGGAVCIFPEGTRHPHAARWRRPRRGVGRLALETGAAVLPVAVHGTEHVRAAGGSARARSRCGSGAR